jgi:hypothetical protein
MCSRATIFHLIRNFELIADFDSKTAEHAMTEFLRRKKLTHCDFL